MNKKNDLTELNERIILPLYRFIKNNKKINKMWKKFMKKRREIYG